MKKKLLTFILTMALWFVFAGRVNIQVFLLGTIICAIISHMLVDTVFKLAEIRYSSEDLFLKIYYIFLVVNAFIYDLFLSAIRVSRHAFEIKPSFSPRIVSIKTSLRNINSIEILANFITLTQGTLVMDVDLMNKNYTIHWIDVHSDHEVEAKKALLCKHENLIAKIFD